MIRRTSSGGIDLVKRQDDEAIVTVWTTGDRKVRVRCWPQDRKGDPAVLTPRQACELATVLLEWAIEVGGEK